MDRFADARRRAGTAWGPALALAIAAFACPSLRAMEWDESFDGPALAAGWAVRGVPDGGSPGCGFRDGQAVLAWRSNQTVCLERELGLDGTNAAPLLLVVSLRDEGPGTSNGLSAVVALAWESGDSVAVGPTGTAQRRRPMLVWRANEAAGTHVSEYPLGGGLNHYRFVLSAGMVDVSVSRDGIGFRHVASLVRSGVALAGAPQRLRIGSPAILPRGPGPAPDDGVSGRGGIAIEHARLARRPPDLPDPEALGYRRCADWESSERTMPISLPLGPLRVFGPLPRPESDAAAVRTLALPGRTAPAVAVPLPAGGLRRGWDLDLGLALGQRDGVFLAVAETRFPADRSTVAELSCDASPRAAVSLNGRLLTGPWENGGVALRAGRQRARLFLPPGSNVLSVAAWDTDRRRGSPKRLLLEVRAHEPLRRLALLKRLEADFPAHPGVWRSRVERADLLAEEGYFDLAVRTLGAPAEDPIPEALAPAVHTRQALWLRRMGRGNEAAAFLHRAMAGGAGAAALFLAHVADRFEEESRSGASLRPAFNDTPAARAMAAAPARALEAVGAGDFAEAGMRLAPASSGWFADDASAEGVLILAGLLERFGLAALSGAVLARVEPDAVDDPALRERLTECAAGTRDAGAMAYLPAASAEARTLLDSADRAAREGDAARAASLWQRALEERAGDWVNDGAGGLTSVGAVVRRRLLSLDEAAAGAYRAQFSAQADRALDEQAATGDSQALLAVADRYPCTAAAGRALDRASVMALDRGRFDMAAVLLGRRSLLPGATPETLAKWAFAAERAGAVTEALDAIARLAARDKSASVTVAGRRWTAAEYAQREADRLRNLPSPPVAPPVARAWCAPVPAPPADEAAAFLQWPHPFRLAPLRPRVTDTRVLVQTSDTVLAFDRRDGRPAWSAAPAAGAARTPAHEALPCLRPACAAGSVFARVRSRGPALAGHSVVIEARRIGDGRLEWSTENRPEYAGLDFTSEPCPFGDRVLAMARMRSDGTRFALVAADAASGRLLWRSVLSADLARLRDEDPGNAHVLDHHGPPTVSGGVCYVVPDAGLVAAVDVFSGSVQWVRSYPRACLAPDGSREARLRALRAPARAWVLGGHVFAAPRDTLSVVCYRAGDGAEVWRRDFTDLREIVGTAGTGAQPLVLALGTTVECLDGRSGERRWRWRPTDGMPPADAAPGPSGVLAVCASGPYWLNAGSGAVERRATWRDCGWRGAPPAGTAEADGAMAAMVDGGVAWLAPGSSPVPEPSRDDASAPRPLAPGAAISPWSVRWRWGIGPADVPAQESGRVLAWCDDRIAVADLDADVLLWERPAGRGWLHAALDPRGAGLVYPQRIVVWDSGTGREAWRWSASVSNGAWDADCRLVAADHAEGVLAVCTTNTVRLLRMDDGTALSVSSAGCEVRSARMIPGRLLVIGQRRARREEWVAEVRDAGSGAVLAREAVSHRPDRPAGAFADAARRLLAAYVGSELVVFDCRDERPAVRRIAMPEYDTAERVELADGRLAVLHLAMRSGVRAWETRICDPGSALEPIAFDGDWRLRGGLAFGLIKGRSAETRYLACSPPDRSAPAWRRPIAVSGEVRRQTVVTGRYALELVSEEHFSELFHDHAREVWDNRERDPHQGGKKGRAAPVLDVRPDGRQENFIECYDVGSGRREARVPFPAPLRGNARPVMIVRGDRLVVATAGGLVGLQLGGPAAPAATRPVEWEAHAVSQAVSVDGRLEEWDAVPPVAVGRRSGFGVNAAGARPAQTAAVVRVAWDDLRLYLAIAVPSPEPRPVPPGGSMHEGDGLLIAVDPESDAGRLFAADGTDDAGDALLHVGLTENGARLVQYRGVPVADPRDRAEDRAQAAAHRVGDVTQYEIALPWPALRADRSRWLEEGDALGLGLIVFAAGAAAPADLVPGPGGMQPVRLVDRRPESVEKLRAAMEQAPGHPAFRLLSQRLALRAGAGAPAGAGAAVLLQEVHPDPEDPPEALSLVVRGERDGFASGFFWADDPRSPGFVRPGFTWLGPCPPAGAWQTLRCPLAPGGIPGAEHTVSVGWAVKNGRAWWGQTALSAGGAAQQVLVSGPETVLAGSGRGYWLDEGPGERAAVHTAAGRSGWSFYHTVSSNALSRAPHPFPGPPPGGWLAACRRGAEALAGDPLLPLFLRESERLPLAAADLAGLYREAVRANPGAAFAHQMLLRLLALESGGEVARQRFVIWLAGGVVGSGSRSPHALGLVLTRQGREWQSIVAGDAPRFNLSNHMGAVTDVHAPLSRIPVRMDIRDDPWVKGDPDARYAIELHVEDNGVAYGTYIGTFRGQALLGSVTGQCDVQYLAAESDSPPERARQALAAVRAFMRECGVTPQQQRLFARALERPDLVRVVPVLP